MVYEQDIIPLISNSVVPIIYKYLDFDMKIQFVVAKVWCLDE